MKRHFTVAGLIAVLAVAVSWGIAQQSDADPDAAELRPFTVLIKETRYGPDGAAGVEEYSIHARRRDGSTVWAVLTAGTDQETVMVRSVTDVRARATVGVDPLTESLIRSPLSDQQIAHLLAPNHLCTEDPNPERRVQHGVAAVRVYREVETAPGRVFRYVAWKAPELGCLELSAEGTLTLPNGPVFRTKRDVIAILKGDPSEELFQIPQHYAQRLPSEVLSERGRLRPELGCDSAACLESAAMLDLAHRARGQGNR